MIEPNRPLREVLCAVLEKAEYVTNICTSPLDLLRYPATGLGEVAVLDLSWYGQEPIQAEQRHCLRLLSEVLPLVVLAKEPGSFTHGLLGAPRVIVISKPLEVDALLDAVERSQRASRCPIALVRPVRSRR